jgi:hypothetical protein
MNINEDIDREKLEKHLFALFLIKATMDRQAQPVVLTDVSSNAMMFSLKMAISEQQMDRLIIEPINKNLKGLYSVSVNSATRIMRVTRVNKAKQIDDSKKVK